MSILISLKYFHVLTFQKIIGIVHPQEVGALICGFIYYITIPSMYMLLLIYSVFNMNDVSWGTREVAPKKVISKKINLTLNIHTYKFLYVIISFKALPYNLFSTFKQTYMCNIHTTCSCM